MKVCPHCHKDLPDDSTFCIYCGKPLKKVSMKDLEKAKEKISKQRETMTSFCGQREHVERWILFV